MKAEINNQSKARFFAQYLGQMYWHSHSPGMIDGINYNKSVFCNMLSHPVGIEGCSVILKPLSAISDEDAIEVAKIFHGYRAADLTESEALNYGRTYAESYSYSTECADFLRSRGYCITWNQISPDEQIAAGWVKLI